MTPKPFQGLRTFCKVSGDTAMRYVVLGFPTDCATTYRPGARFAPGAIRESSMMLTDGEHPSFGVDLTKHVADLGDADITTGNILKILGQVEHVASNVLNWDKHPVFLGGDHSITLGILRAVNKMYGKVAVVHFDAHCDTWSNNFDEPIGHGTWLYNAIKEGIVDPAKVFSIGIRSPADAESRSFLEDHGGTTFTARYAQSNMQSVINSILGTIENTPVYLSFDIDCLDPAHAPGTGTPEIGGLTSMWVLECLESLFGLNWVGMDMVEVSPTYDHSSITSLAAATICWTYLSMIIAKSLDTSDVFDCGDTADDTDFRNIEEDASLVGPTGPT